MRSVMLLMAALIPSAAQAETYRCSLPRVITLEEKGVAKDETVDGDKVAEIYFTIQRNPNVTIPGSGITAREMGSSSICTNACARSLDIAVTFRGERSLRLLLADGGQLWSLESSEPNPQNYRAVVISPKKTDPSSDQTSISMSAEVSFGSCRRVMD